MGVNSHYSLVGIILVTQTSGILIQPNLGFGAMVTDLDLGNRIASLGMEPLNPEGAWNFTGDASKEALQKTAMEIKRLLHKYRFVHLPSQNLSWKEQLILVQLMGEPFEESTSVNREKFQGEYDSRVAVISNNKYRGLTGIGTEGFHQDGNVVDIPHAINFLYCESSISGGDTLLVPNHEVRAVLERRYPSLELDQVNFVSRQTLISQPLMFNHPVTGRPTMFYALGTLSGRYTRNGRDLSKEQTDTIIAAIDAAIEEIGFYSHTWSKGDLLMMDNIAMAHRASSGSQSKPSETVGSRVLRRVTLRGTRKLQRRSFIDATLLTGPLFPRRCSEDKCLVSLARWVDYKDGDGLFLGLSESRELCKYALDESADLAILPTKELAGMATEIVAETAVPHWILGTEYSNNSFISWPSPSDLVDQWDETGSTTSSTAASRERYPWHEESGQPNDCDGPDSEPCIFVGPNGKWFDFACERKTAPGTTPGPEITWTTGVRKMYNLHPLCMVDSAVVIDALQKQSSQVHEEL